MRTLTVPDGTAGGSHKQSRIQMGNRFRQTENRTVAAAGRGIAGAAGNIVERKCGNVVRRIDYVSEKILQTCLLRTEQEIPANYRQKLEPVLKYFQPETMADCIKMIGLLHTPREWHEKCLFLRENYGLTLQEIPVFREDIFEHIRDGLFSVGETESGLAVSITDRILRGTYRHIVLDRDTEGNLRSMGTEPWFRDVLPYVPYLFPKGFGVMTMQEFMWYVWYNQNVPEMSEKLRCRL